MKYASPAAVLLVGIILSILAAGCASGPRVTAVTITNPSAPPTVAGGGSVSITANVSPTNGAVNWSLSGATCGSGCGSLSNQTATTVTYTAPPSVPTSFSVTVTATSVTSRSKSASININVAAISVNFQRKVTQLAAVSLQSGGPVVFFAAITHFDPSDAGVTWTLTAGGGSCSPTCGSLSNANPDFVAYSPPSSVPAAPNNMPTITATSVTDTTKSDTDSFTIFNAATVCAPGGNEGLLNGQYAILLQGWTGTGSGTPVIYVASFGADGTGKITLGEDRLNLFSSSTGGGILPSASSYSVGQDNRGCLTLTDAFDNTQTLHFSLGGVSGGVASKGDIILFDQQFSTPECASGILRRQDPSSFSLSALASNYTVGLAGWDNSTGTLTHLAIAGSFAQNAGTVSSPNFNANDGGTLLSMNEQFVNSGTIQPIAATGVTQADLFLPVSGSGSVSVEIYVINSSELFFVSDTISSGGAVFSGRAIAAPSSFTASSLAPSYIFRSTGSGSSGAAASIGLMNFSSVVSAVGISGTISGTLDQYSVGNFATSSLAESYAFTPLTGLVSIYSNATLSGTPSQYLYLTTPYDGVAGFSITTDATAPLGVFEVQPYGFSGGQPIPVLSGNFILGSSEPGDNTALDICGVATVLSPMLALSGTEDIASPSGLTLANSFTTGLLSLGSDGTGYVGPNTFAVTNGTELFFLNEGSGGPNFPPEVQVVEH